MTKELIKFLKKERPELHKTLERQGNTITYIPWNRVVGIFDEAVELGLINSWNYKVDEVAFGGQFTRKNKDGTKEAYPVVHVKVSIQLVTEYGDTTRQAVGSEALDAAGYGDPISNATAMAFRRAAAMFGVGLYLYEKEDGENRPRIVSGEPQASNGTANTGQKKPVTINPEDLLMPKPRHQDAPTDNQWNYLMKLLKMRKMDLNGLQDLVIELGLDVDDLEKLTFGHVKTLIDHLKNS